ncbi:hypothetical protein NW762_012158 [Fusarium torreyae]|uniref:Uncharacterized protein n=1 Tax=Fusarium torreyae TaxID=1237075 RepID=A0A9W8RSC6_9HYPO|nr:hypothetical protein NW762_012158 [Fusarium torreyae]
MEINREYNQSCHYARSIGKRGRKPNSRKATHLPSSSRAIRPQRIDNDTQEGNGDSSEADCELEQSTPHPQPPQRQPGTSQDIINYEAIAAPQSITDADEITSPLYPSSVPQATTGRITDNPNSFSSRTHATPPQLLAGTATTSSSRHAYHHHGIRVYPYHPHTAIAMPRRELFGLQPQHHRQQHNVQPPISQMDAVTNV